MIYDEYTGVKVGGYCVIIRTGELGIVGAVNKETREILLEIGRAKRKEWFHYTELAKI